jgi:hypothetical protein
MLMSMPIGGGDPFLINGDSSSSSKSMSSLEVVGAGISAFSYTLHSCYVGNIGRIVLKCSSLSFSATSYFNFCALIHWILLLRLCVSPGGHQRGAGAVPGMVVLNVCFCPETVEIGWSGFGNWTVRYGGHCELVPASILASVLAPGTLSRFTATSSGPVFP